MDKGNSAKVLLNNNPSFSTQGGRGHWAVFYTSLKIFFITFFIPWLNNFEDFHWTLIGRFIKLSVQMFQSPIVEVVILCTIIEDVHHFIGFCLIPLDPCFSTPIFTSLQKKEFNTLRLILKFFYSFLFCINKTI